MFTGRRIRVILNPNSGTERGQEYAERISRAISSSGPAELDLRKTSGPDDAWTWASEAAEEGFDVVIAAGGDGSVTGVAHGILKSKQEKRPAVGIIPLGTGNGLARVLGLPMDPLAAVKTLSTGKLVDLDALDVHSHDATSLLFLGAGLDAEINRDADSEEKSRLGFMAYVNATFTNMRNRRNHSVRLVVDGQERLVQAHTISVFNATRLELLGAKVGPDAHPHDGYAELSVMSSPGLLGVVGQVLRIVADPGGHPELEDIRELEIEARPPMLVHIDGDVVGETPVKLKMVPAALKFIASARYQVPD